MELQIGALSDTVTKAAPIGRWDVVGAAAIDLRLSALAGSGRSVIIDLTQVSFLSSMGIRSILMSAKAVKLRGAKLVLLSPEPQCRDGADQHRDRHAGADPSRHRRGFGGDRRLGRCPVRLKHL